MTRSSARSGHSSLRSAIVLALVLSGEPGIGKTILGGRHRGGTRHTTSDPYLSRRRGRGVIVVRRAVRAPLPVLDETISLLVPPPAESTRGGAAARRTRRRGSGRSCDRSRRPRRPLYLGPTRPRRRRRRRHAVARPRLRPHDADRVRRLHAERVGLLGTLRRTPERRVSWFEARWCVRGGTNRTAHGWSALPECDPQPAARQARTGTDAPELARVQEATAGNPFFALGTRSRAHSNEH